MCSSTPNFEFTRTLEYTVYSSRETEPVFVAFTSVRPETDDASVGFRGRRSHSLIQRTLSTVDV